VRSTIHPALQKAAEVALQEGLARYELSTGRTRFHGAEADLGAGIQKLQAEAAAAGPPAAPVAIGGNGKAAAPLATQAIWQRALQAARLPLYDVHWAPGVVLEGRQEGRDPGRTRRRTRVAVVRGNRFDSQSPRAARRGLCPGHGQ
jgi:hypothetical protein